ncbi:hypothetical protein F0L67_26965 [Escherichia coli]|nr:hypothetical protein [Escherichia coli]QIL68219.1 hypothetical protein F0L67_26965 [Escherichia coli]
MGEISVKTGNNARNGGKNSLNRLIRCVCGKKIGPDPRNFNQRVSLGRNDLLIRTFLSKRGNKKIRTLLVQCARVFIQKLEHQSGKLADWVRDLLCRKSNFVVTCALANKLARIAWALTARQQTYVA